MSAKVYQVHMVAGLVSGALLVLCTSVAPARAQVAVAPPSPGPVAPMIAQLPIPMPTPLSPTSGQGAVETVPAPPPSLPGSINNGQTPPLSLDQLESMAIANNPTLTQAAARVAAQKGNWQQQGLYPNPSLTYVGDEMGDSNTAGFQGFNIRQEIVTTGKLKKAQNVAAQQINQAEQEFSTQELRVRNDVKLRFYDVLLAQRNVTLNQELEQIARSSTNAANDLYKAAEGGRSDVLQAQVESSLIQLQTVKARNAQQSAWRQLAIVVGFPELEMRPLVGDLRADIIETTWDQAWACLSSSSPELASAQAKVAAAQSAVEKARADRFQNWEMQAGYSHDNSTGFDTGGISVSIPLPLYNRNQGAISQADAELRAAQAEVGRVALDLRNRLALVFERYANAKEMVDRYEKSIIPDAKEAIDLNSNRYRAGEGSFPSLLLSQRDYLRTEVSYLDALRELRETSVLLQGLLLSDSLLGAGR